MLRTEVTMLDTNWLQKVKDLDINETCESKITGEFFGALDNSIISNIPCKIVCF